MSGLTSVAASATRSAFEETAGVWLESRREQLQTVLRSRIPALVAEVTGAFAVEFASVLLRGLLDSENSTRRIEKGVSKLVREPIKTALEQFRTASGLRPSDADGHLHQAQRFRECLVSLDRALSVAEESDIPMIHLLRGTCALQVPGGTGEATEHLRRYVEAIDAQAEKLREKAAVHDATAEKSEAEAQEVPTPLGHSTFGHGVGGGFVGMAVSEPRIRKASLLYLAGRERRQAEQSRIEARELSTAAEYARALAEVASKPS